MATTKLRGRFENLKAFETKIEQINDTAICVTKMNGMIARSTSLSAVNWDASFVKTIVFSVQSS